MNEEVLEEHSQAKLELYRKYLQRYLPIMVRTGFEKINIFDLLCGKGVYENGHGSPLVAAECIALAKEGCVNPKEITLHINDVNKSKVATVCEAIRSNPRYNCFSLEVSAQEMNVACESFIRKAKLAREHNLFFIDPYGYKEIKKELIQDIMDAGGKNEIILFLPVVYLYRFRKNATKDEIDKSYEPLRKFIRDFVEYNEDDPALDFIKKIKTGLSFNGKYYASSFYIERTTNQFFALFFMTRNLLGLEKIIEAKWEIDSVTGSGAKRHCSKTLFDDFFTDQRIDELKKIIIAKVNDGITNDLLYKVVLESDCLPKHANGVIKEMRDHILITDLQTGKETKSTYLNYTSYSQGPKVKLSKRQ